MFRISTAIVALLLTDAMGLACSNSGLKGRAGDAGAGTEGQAGSTISSGTTGGAGGTIGPGGAGGGSIGGTGGLSSPGGAGGTNISGTGGIIGFGGSNGSGPTAGSSGTGGQTCSLPPPRLVPGCNPGDQEIGDACLPGRECYSLQFCPAAPILCMLPEAVHCSDPLSCVPGYKASGFGFFCGGTFCYTEYLCTQSLVCMQDTTPHACTGSSSDGGLLGAQDASPGGSDAGRLPCCGDGIVDVDNWEQCDFGNLNGLCLDSLGHPLGYPENADCQPFPASCNCPAGTLSFCSTTCQIPIIPGG
jgi:hypothetical protein